jgi:hypothetical protein
MFKRQVIRLLKENGIYHLILQKGKNDMALKSLLNSPYLNSILQYINKFIYCQSIHNTIDFDLYKLDDEKFKYFFHKKDIIIEDIEKKDYKSIQNYLFNNGIIWCNDSHVYNDSIWNSNKLSLYINDRGKLTYSIGDWRPDNMYDYLPMSLDEFYVYFEDFKMKIKQDIKDCFIKGNQNYNYLNY